MNVGEVTRLKRIEAGMRAFLDDADCGCGETCDPECVVAKMRALVDAPSLRLIDEADPQEERTTTTAERHVDLKYVVDPARALAAALRMIRWCAVRLKSLKLANRSDHKRVVIVGATRDAEARLLAVSSVEDRLDWLDANSDRLEELFGALHVRNEYPSLRAAIDAFNPKTGS